MKVRRAKIEDMKEIVKICHEEVYDELSLRDIEDWFKNSGNFPYIQYFVAEENGEIIGFIGWSFFDRYWDEIILEIASMAIKEGYQRAGIGKALLENSLEEVRRYWSKKGLKVVMYLVDTDEENKKACRFYEKVIKPTERTLIPSVFNGRRAKIFYFKKLNSS